MNKAAMNLGVDLLAAGVLTGMVGSGYVLWWALPPGSNRTHELWGWSRHDWGFVHALTSVVLLAILGLHVALHWRWLVMGMFKRLGGARGGGWAEAHPRLSTTALLVLTAGVLGGVIGGAQLSVRGLPSPRHLLIERPPDRPSIAPGDAGPGAGTSPADRAAVQERCKTPSESLSCLSAAAESIVVARCASCHDGPRPAAGFRSQTAADLRAAAGEPAWVVPGDPRGSRLLRLLEIQEPPAAATDPQEPERRLGKHELPATEHAVLRAWIAALPPQPGARAP